MPGNLKFSETDSLRLTLDQLGTDFGPAWDRLWINLGSTLDQLGIDFGQLVLTLDLLGTDLGSTLDRPGLTLDQLGTVFGPTWDRLEANLGPT